MHRLRVPTGREACRVLHRHGFVGVLQRRTDAGSVTGAIPDHYELAIGTLSIAQHTEGPRTEFEECVKRVSVAWDSRPIPFT
jgi:hypothetical protein